MLAAPEARAEPVMQPAQTAPVELAEPEEPAGPAVREVPGMRSGPRRLLRPAEPEEPGALVELVAPAE